MRYFLEACCTDAVGAVTAQRNGAARVELCSELDIGGVTPSENLIRQTLLSLAEDSLSSITPVDNATPIPVNVLVRPRDGDFVYSEEEILQTLAGIEMCKFLSVRDSAGSEHRINGVVVGALRPDGGIDMKAMRRLVAAARPLQVTFHRAFDECADVDRCLEDVIALGCERLLTSGHAPDAFEGRFTLARLVRRAAGRIVILAGRGIRPHNIAAIASAISSTTSTSPISTPSSFPTSSIDTHSSGTSVSVAFEFHSSVLIGW